MAASVDGTNASATTTTRPDLVERTGRRLHELGVRDDRVERAEHGHHADDGESLGERLEHDGQLDGAAHGEAAEELRQPEVRGGEQDVADAVGGRRGEQHADDREEHSDRDQDRERARVRARDGRRTDTASAAMPMTSAT